MAIYDIENKLEVAEDKAWDVIRTYDLPMRLDGFGPSLAILDQDQNFANLSERDQSRVFAARDVLIAVRKVRRCRKRGDVEGALNYIRYIEQDPDLLDHARRGAKVGEGASAGGVATASANRPETEAKINGWRQLATQYWGKHPEWSASGVGRYIARETGGNPDTIRRRIGDVKPQK